MSNAGRGNLFLISGPSGVGKGTICRELLKRDSTIYFSVSATTRKPRNEDIEGKTYFFKSTEEFERLIEEDAFLEWAMYGGKYYGTLKKPVFIELEKGRDVILEIDVIEVRLNAAKKELSFKDKYDYVVINDKIEDAISEIENIINKERDTL